MSKVIGRHKGAVVVIPLLMATACVLFFVGLPARAQAQDADGPGGYQRLWFGPVGILRSQIARFSITNGGTEPVSASWQYSDARTGARLQADITVFHRIEPGTGLVTDLYGTDRALEGHFDSLGKAQLVGWLIIEHAPGDRLRVDLGSVEILDETGKTTNVVLANPGAVSYVAGAVR